LAATASTVVATTIAGSRSAARMARVRRKMSGFRDSGIDRVGPRSKAKKSLAFTIPTNNASAPAARVTQARWPKTWNTLSQAAMKAKYISPETLTKMLPMSSMRARLF
jgi:hypothetical protein